MTATLLRGVRRIGTSGAPCDVLCLGPRRRFPGDAPAAAGPYRWGEGRIASVTPTSAGAPLASGIADLDVVDADGAWVGPGLWDHHVHFDQWSLVRRRIDVSGAGSAEAVAELLHDAWRTGTTDPVVIGHGYRDGLWPSPATVDRLDAAVPSLPAVVVSGDLHAVWCNTLALTHFAAVLGRPLPHVDGVLREQDAFDVTGALSQVDDALLDAWAGDAADVAATRGVVGIVDLEMRYGGDRWARRVRAGVDELRVRSGVYPHDLESAIARGLRTGVAVEGSRGLVEVGPFKVVTDGSLGTRTAFVAEPYAGLSSGHDHGVLAWPVDELLPLVRRAVEAGFVPAIHAIGDAANTIALDVFEALGVRGTVEHAQLLRDTDVDRFARLGVAASVQPEHAMDDRDIADRYWADRTGRAFPFGALERAGAQLLLGSDAPVAPLDPWVAMAAAVGRDRDGREAWHPAQRTSALAAWRGSTGGPVSVAVGDVADLVLVPSDPLASSSAALRTMPVLATMLDGRFTHREL